MSSTPTWIGTPFLGRADVSTANTGRDGSGTLVTPAWMGSGYSGADVAFVAGAPATNWQLNRISVGSTGDLADCVLTVFSTDGTTIKFLTDIDLGNAAAASATATGVVMEVPLSDFRFPAGCDLRLGITAAPASGVAVVTLFADRA
jgi:hypothetical protein